MLEEERIRFQGYYQDVLNEEKTEVVDVIMDVDDLRKNLSEEDFRIAVISYCIRKAITSSEAVEMVDIAEFINEQLKEHKLV